MSLRFNLPKISFAEETLAAYESSVGIPYLTILDKVLEKDLIEEVEVGDRETNNKIRVKAASTAQGMLLYLANLWDCRSRSNAVKPPLNSSMVTWWRKNYPFFDETVFDFEEEMSDAAEDELYVRAVVGTPVPTVVNGNIEFLTKKSDDLLKYYLTHNRPKRYSQKLESKVEQKTELSGAVGVTLDKSSLKNMSDSDIDALEALLLKAEGK